MSLNEIYQVLSNDWLSIVYNTLEAHVDANHGLKNLPTGIILKISIKVERNYSMLRPWNLLKMLVPIFLGNFYII